MPELFFTWNKENHLIIFLHFKITREYLQYHIEDLNTFENRFRYFHACGFSEQAGHNIEILASEWFKATWQRPILLLLETQFLMQFFVRIKSQTS